MTNRAEVYKHDIIQKCRDTVMRRHYEYLINMFKDKQIEFKCTIDEYNGYHFSNIYKFTCIKCERSFESTVYKPDAVMCRYCHPFDIDTWENEFLKFLQEVLPKDVIIKQNDRTVLYGKELDFYIPALNLAIELNGLYWHSEVGQGKNKEYHLNKTKSCGCHGITLVHIFENEWMYKKDIVKSIIKRTCKVAAEKIDMSACNIKVVDTKEKNIFLTNNCLMGKDKFSIGIGVYRGNDLLSMMTFKKIKKSDRWDVSRVCRRIGVEFNNNLDFKEIFNLFKLKYDFKTLVGYVDRRYSDSDLFKSLGFKFTDYTPQNYHYIVDNYKNLRHRLDFQKHSLHKVLTTFDPNLSTWENMKSNGYDRIWDCGYSRYIFTSGN